MDKAIGTGSIDRSARVRRLKRVIIGLILFAVLLPTVLCILLFFKIGRLENEIADLSLKKETITVVTDKTHIKEINVSQPDSDGEVLNVDNVVRSMSADHQMKTLSQDDEDSVISIVNDDSAAADKGINKVIEFTDDDNNNALSDEGKVKRVYLTFDDGPSSNTERILDILKEYNVKATFFVVGRVNETTSPLYKRIVKEGHTIGMHSFSHKYNEVYASEDSFLYDVEKIQTTIYEQTGVMTKYYRFPGGSSNTVSKVPVSKLKKQLSDRGIIYYDWNVSSGDATSASGLSKDEIFKNCVSGSIGKDEVMILMHDLPEKAATVEALPQIIEYFQDIGAEIVPVDETSGQFLHGE